MGFSLPSTHYAARWSTDQINSNEQVTEKGRRYAALAEGPEREQLLLELLQSFHNYLIKYVAMILRGHVPVYHGRANPDTVALLKFFLPGGQQSDNCFGRARIFRVRPRFRRLAGTAPGRPGGGHSGCKSLKKRAGESAIEPFTAPPPRPGARGCSASGRTARNRR